jgi:hypothetical protein
MLSIISTTTTTIPNSLEVFENKCCRHLLSSIASLVSPA